jgi:TolA-binding protein
MTVSRMRWLWLLLAVPVVFGCARYNTYYNANKAFQKAEQVREDKIKNRQDVTKPDKNQIQNYQTAIKKCQILLDEYPGHGLTDDALFLMAKSNHRIQSYRMSISNLDLLFENFPANEFAEEALFVQAVNYMFIDNATRSSQYLDDLRRQYPDSRYAAEADRLSGENAFALEKWAEARDDFIAYLDNVHEDVDRGGVEFKLAKCHWELKEYEEAAELLQAVSGDIRDKATFLDTQLLLARCLIRSGDFEQAGDIAQAVTPEAELYQKNGMLLLVRAENLMAQDNREDAVALIENMPDEWRTSEVSARLGEMLGYMYLSQWRLEDAHPHFRAAIRNTKALDQEERTRLINTELGRYLTTTNRLDSATPEQQPALKLVQANVMMGPLESPRRALDIYLDVMESADLDSASAVRAMYGAVIIYRDHLALPDSAAAVQERLLNDFPDSPQAFTLRNGEQGDLFAYLMKQDEIRVAAAMAAADSQSLLAPDDAVQLAEAKPMITDEEPERAEEFSGEVSRRNRWRMKRPKPNTRAYSERGWY